MAVIGIDLGTTNSLAVCFKDDKLQIIRNSAGETVTPSAVSFADSGELLVGAPAKERLITHPFASVSQFKRSMGLNMKFPMAPSPELKPAMFSPEELSAMVLRKIKEDAEVFLGESVEEAVISVPAYFDDNCRRAVKTAAQIAGIPVKRLVNEPSAAALAYQYRHDFKDGLFLVVDFGGGTLDISVVDAFEGVVEILAVAGDNHLGGKDISSAIADSFCQEKGFDSSGLSPQICAEIYRQAEKCKEALTVSGSASVDVNIDGKIYSSVFDEKRLLNVMGDIPKRLGSAIKRALRDARCTPADIDAIIAVGGSCKMPVIRRYISELINKPVSDDIDPDTAIAEGAGIFAGMKSREKGLKDVILTDICPFSLGIAVMNRELRRETTDFIIERNSPLPTSCVKQYYGGKDGQSFVRIKVFQGESMWCEKNLFLGELTVNCPPSSSDKPICSVTLAYDINGILTVDVLTHADNRLSSKVFLSGGNNMSYAEIDACIERLNAIKLTGGEDEKNAAASARAERIASELIGEDRQKMQEALYNFKAAAAHKNSFEIRKLRDELVEMMNHYDI